MDISNILNKSLIYLRKECEPFLFRKEKQPPGVKLLDVKKKIPCSIENSIKLFRELKKGK